MMKIFEQDVSDMPNMCIRPPNEAYKPHMVGERFNPFPFVERESTVRELCGVLRHRWTDLQSADKSEHPLHGFHAISGGGKSFFIDNFMHLDFSQNEVRDRYLQCWSREDQVDFSQKWKRSLRLSITFNRDFEGSSDFHDRPDQLVAARLLHSHLVIGNGPDFVQYLQLHADAKSKDLAYLKPNGALQMILHRHRMDLNIPPSEPVHCVIFLDEVLKVHFSKSSEVVSQFCALMHQAPSYNASVTVFSTTLDPDVLEQERAHSNRQVVLHSLPALQHPAKFFQTDVQRMFAVAMGGVCLYYQLTLLTSFCAF